MLVWGQPDDLILHVHAKSLTFGESEAMMRDFVRKSGVIGQQLRSTIWARRR
jgi:hypothetical protein